MKTISAALAAHLQQETTTLCTMWKATRLDGQVFTFTDHDQDLVFPAGSPTGLTYIASSGYTRSAIQTTGALNVDNLDLDGAFQSAYVTEDDIIAGRWDYASIEIFVVNWNDLTQGSLPLRKGRMGEVRSGRGMFVTELRGMTQNLQQDIGRLCGASCDADLGDTRCGVVLTGGSPTAYMTSGSVTTVDSTRVFYDSNLTSESGWFNGGKITFTSGDNIGLSMEVKTYTLGGSPTPNQIVLQLPMPHGIGVSDTYTIQAGCDKRIATCLNKYNNVVNFRGFPYIPGVDQIVTGGL